MSKKRFLRLLSLVVMLFFISTAVAVVAVNRSMAYGLRIENSYKRSFHELIDCTNKITYSLKKCVYSTSPKYIATVCSEINRQAVLANMCIAELPFSNSEIQETSKFTSVVGSYSFTLQKNIIENQTITNGDKEGLNNLLKVSDDLQDKLLRLNERVSAGEITFSEFVKKDVGTVDESVEKDVLEIEEQFPDFPTLVFDGPFSEHISRKSPKFIEDKAKISADDAKKIASDAFGIPVANFKISESVNKLPTYTLYGDYENNNVSIDITRQGGAILNYTNARKPGDVKLKNSEAIDIAKKFLKKIGLGEFEESYTTEYANQILINLAPIENGIKLYPDLVKVTVALDNGSINNVEALGFIMNHYERGLSKVAVPSYSAQQISPELSVKAINTALIPTPAEGEILTFEFICKTKDNKNLIIYKNVDTLDDVDIKILIEQENGVLAI